MLALQASLEVLQFLSGYLWGRCRSRGSTDVVVSAGACGVKASTVPDRIMGRLMSSCVNCLNIRSKQKTVTVCLRSTQKTVIVYLFCM